MKRFFVMFVLTAAAAGVALAHPGASIAVVAAAVAVPGCTAIPGIGRERRPYLRGLAVAPDGVLYVAASGCGAVLKIDRAGKTTVVLRTEAPWSPTAVTFASGELYVLEYLHTASDDRSECAK
ncbi:MAG TPA: hypothetical protein VGR02_04570 [Thermoanaerobaculia bacterium]|jgi:DNA-binding beta-propeller fold protein YncE|nr:hypothetical protein [Thermoanaerobaculia bacterium]